MEKGKKKGSILSSTLTKVIVFFLLAISFVTSVAGGYMTAMLWESHAYTVGMTSVIKDMMRSQLVWDDVNYVRTLYEEGDIKGIEAYLDRRNVSMEIYNYEEIEGEEMILLWSNYGGIETIYSFNCYTEMHLETIAEPKVEEGQSVLFRVYVNDTFPYEDEYKAIHEVGIFLRDGIYVIPIVAAVSVLVFFGCFIYLMCSAGHHRGKEGITGGVLYFIPFDIVTVVFGFVACVWLILIDEMTYGGMGLIEIIFILAILVLELIWCTIYCMDLAVELKKGTLFKHTLIWGILRWFIRGVKALWKGFLTMMRGLPLVLGAMIAYIGFSIVQLVALAFFCVLWSMDGDVLILCFLEKIVLTPIVLYFALVCKKLQKGSKALAEGELSYKLDTTKMFWGFKEHGENLNRLGEGIAVAVDERMKSEHLKTELITNVSHDLKTPLTSIINYADLIGAAVNNGVAGEAEQAQLAEYSEVLVRQSKRLKKLLEDLVEASKATTGNLEVKLELCEVSVILSQAVGEYVQRFSEKELILLIKQPEEPVYIQADGRHLWRVFDNLLNNICKYAQESSRVYLTVESKEKIVEIVFRNMSKYQLDVSAEELQERFVRGDKSRHMEGNGLGLSIAGSLVELQGGTMEIVTDGDLFKVILGFEREEIKD